MTPGALTGGGFFWLAIFMLVGLTINKLKGRPTVNGALVYCQFLSVVTLILIVGVAFRPSVAEQLVGWVGGLLLPYLVGMYYGRKFSKRNATFRPTPPDA